MSCKINFQISEMNIYYSVVTNARGTKDKQNFSSCRIWMESIYLIYNNIRFPLHLLFLGGILLINLKIIVA